MTDYRNADLIRRNSILMAPSVHPAESIDDAVTMLDSRIPLTYRERMMIVQSLWDLAFREGARQGRLAGYEAATADALDRLDAEAVAADVRREYPDTTTVIRKNLTAKARVRDGLPPVPTTNPMTEQFLAPYPER
jgi:hypothetical protein